MGDSKFSKMWGANVRIQVILVKRRWSCLMCHAAEALESMLATIPARNGLWGFSAPHSNWFVLPNLSWPRGRWFQ